MLLKTFLFYLAGLPGWSVAILPARRLDQEELSLANRPFTLPKSKQLKVRPAQYRTHAGYSALGVCLEVVDKFNPGSLAATAFSDLSKQQSISYDSTFFEKATNFFSQPYIHQAKFLEWRDPSGTPVYSIAAPPEEATAILFDDYGSKLQIDLRVNRRVWDLPVTILTFWRQTGPRFVIASSLLQSILQHLSPFELGGSEVHWIIHKLAHSPDTPLFEIEVSKNSRQQILWKSNIFEFVDGNNVRVTERYFLFEDHFTRFFSAPWGLKWVEVQPNLINKVKIQLPQPVKDPHEKIVFEVTKEIGSLVSVDLTVMTEALKQLSGITLPPFKVRPLISQLETKANLGKFVFPVQLDLDLRLWQLTHS